MPCTLYLRRTFPELEEILLRDLASAGREHRFAPKWVLAPSGTLARFLAKRAREKLLEAPGGVWGGVRFVSLSFFSSRLYQVIFGRNPFNISPFNEISLDSLVRDLSGRSPLAPLKEIESGGSLLASTFRDLADAGFGSGQEELLLEAVGEGGVSDREKEILKLYFKWIEELNVCREPWAPLCQQELVEWIEAASKAEVARALGEENGDPVQIFVHGFYDFTDNNLQILAGLSRTQSLYLYFPDNRRGKEAHPAFGFSDYVLREIRLRMGTRTDEDTFEPEVERQNRAAADFFDRTFLEGQPASQPPFLTWQRASSPRAEALSAALRARRWVDEDGIEPRDIMVVLTSSETYLDSVIDIFEEFCLPVNLLDCPVELTRESTSRSLLGWLWKDSAPVERLLQYLREHPNFCARHGVDAFEFEAKLRKVMFGGGADWNEVGPILKSLAREKGDIRQLSREEEKLIELIISSWVDKPVFPASPESAAKLLETLSCWFEDDRDIEAVITSLRKWGRFRPEDTVSESLFASLAFKPSGPKKPRSKVEADGVKVVPLMRARGMTCRAVVLLGLSSGLFPRKIEEDHFLGDEARAELAKHSGILGHKMPVKNRATDEMALLFYLFNTSAELVHWVVPETDSAGRLVSPTSWIQNYLQYWTPGKSSFLGRIAPAPIQQAEYLRDLDRSRGSLLPPGLAYLLDPGERRPILDWAGVPGRWAFYPRDRADTPAYFGQVREASFPEMRSSLGVTSLQVLARCPFQFYAEKLLEALPLEEQDFPESLNAMDRGVALHSALEHLFKGCRNAAEAFRRIAAKPEYVAEAVDNALADFPGFRLIPPLLRKRSRDEMAGLILDYLEFAADRTSPKRRFLGFEQPLEHPLPGIPGTRLRGVIDRIDLDEESGALHLIDYKSGPNRELRVAKKNPVLFSLGWSAQASLYRWMWTSSREEPKVDFSYFFLAEPDLKKKEILAEPAVPAAPLLESLESILSTGSFIPSDNNLMEDYQLDFLEPCRNCSFSSLCRRIDSEKRGRMAELFQRECRVRAEFLRDTARRYQAEAGEKKEVSPEEEGDGKEAWYER